MLSRLKEKLTSAPMPVSGEVSGRSARTRIALFSLSVILAAACAREVGLIDGVDGGNTGNGGVPELENSNGISARSVLVTGESELGYRGVDILLVVDEINIGTSVKNAVEGLDDFQDTEQRLASELFALIVGLMHPLGDTAAVAQIRVALTSSNMGVQYGRLMQDTVPESMVQTLPLVDGCSNLGDNGNLLPMATSTTSVNLENGRMPCQDYGPQCPVGWSCGASGRCEARNGDTWLECSGVDARLGTTMLSTTASPSSDLALAAACLVRRDPSPCPIDQPLEAMIKSLNRNPGFLVPNHALVVYMLSYRDDCSIENPALFDSDAWAHAVDRETTKVRCFADDNRQYLFDTQRYVNDLRELKDGNASAVFFNAIVGAPSEYTGTGDAAAGPVMSTALEHYEGTDEGYYDFLPACKFNADDDDRAAPRPGFRQIDVAIQFGEKGYVQSMCDPSWQGMTERTLANLRNLLSFDGCKLEDPLDVVWPLEVCPNCQQTQCDLYVEFVRTGQDAFDLTCPKALMFGDDYTDKAAYTGRSDSGVVRVYCPVQNLPAPLDCQSQHGEIAEDAVGWYYCQNLSINERTEYTCSDGIDNDGANGADCDDDGCSDCRVCGSETGNCLVGCPNEIVLTKVAKQIIGDNALFLDCPFPFSNQ